MFLTLDSNIFISAYKGNEEFSSACIELIARIPNEFNLIEPSIVLTEIYRAIGAYFGADEGRKRANDVRNMSYLLVDCGTSFCLDAGATAVKFDTYSADSLYLQTMLRYKTVLVTLDEEEFLKKVKKKDSKLKAYHVKDFPF
ncbi:MAG: type II toxin-antitoxin system VapC family toxin [Candidatus Hydrothermarchaeota archaeon]|nr:type II toxin-antitoxin system VapC family toxin [Candidatus Hydrothermarchaeota archaeon]